MRAINTAFSKVFEVKIGIIKMDRNFSKALALVLRHEGGYVNHPSDPGGHTNKGITLATFRRYIKPGGTVADLRAITPEQVATCYRRHYWEAVRANELPDGVDYAVFDFAVNSGPNRAAKYLQGVVGAKQDGIVGPATVAATRAKMPVTVIHEICDRRMAFLRGLKTFATFGRGWTNRVTDVRKHALDMTSAHAAPSPAPKPQPSPEPAPAPAQGFWAALASFISKLFGKA